MIKFVYSIIILMLVSASAFAQPGFEPEMLCRNTIIKADTDITVKMPQGGRWSAYFAYTNNTSRQSDVAVLQSTDNGRTLTPVPIQAVVFDKEKGAFELVGSAPVSSILVFKIYFEKGKHLALTLTFKRR
jgi:hypothetical protein